MTEDLWRRPEQGGLIKEAILRRPDEGGLMTEA